MDLHYVGISAAFDPYAQARPVGRCAECGAALYDGDRVYYGLSLIHIYLFAAGIIKADGDGAARLHGQRDPVGKNVPLGHQRKAGVRCV